MPVIPGDNDVLFGRGFTISAHPGNRHLRTIVQNEKPGFLKAKKKEKRKIAKRIVDGITELDPPGRFLIEDTSSSANNSNDDDGTEKDGILDKVWTPVDTEKAVDKVMHRLREKERPPAGSTSVADQLHAAQMHQNISMQHPSMRHNIGSSMDQVNAAVAQQQVAAQQLAMNPNLHGGAMGLIGGVQTGLINLHQPSSAQSQSQSQQAQQQFQQQQQQSMPQSTDELNNFLQSMQQSIDNNFLATLANNNIGGQNTQNQPQQQQQTANSILQQQLNSLQQQAAAQQQNNFGQQHMGGTLDMNHQNFQQAVDGGNIMSNVSMSSIQHQLGQQHHGAGGNMSNLSMTTLQPTQQPPQQMQNVQFPLLSPHNQANQVSTASGLSGGSSNSSMNQSQQFMGQAQMQNQQFASQASALSDGSNISMNSNGGGHQVMQNQQFTNFQQPIDEVSAVSNFAANPNGFGGNNNSSPAPSDMSMLAAQMGGMHQQSGLGLGSNNNMGGIDENLPGAIGSPVLSDTSGLNRQQMSQSPDNRMNFVNLPAANNMAALTCGLSDASSVSTAGSGGTNSRHNSFVLSTQLEAIDEQPGGRGSGVAWGNNSNGSMLPPTQEVTTNEEAIPVNTSVNQENFDDVMGSFLDDMTSSDNNNVAPPYPNNNQNQMMQQGSNNQGGYYPAKCSKSQNQKQQQPPSPLLSSSADLSSQEVTLRGWIDVFSPLPPAMTSGLSPEMSKYIKSLVIPLAIKLVDHLIERRGSSGNNDVVEVPSIACEHIFVYMKQKIQNEATQEQQQDILDSVVIDQVIIKNGTMSLHDSTGSLDGELFALGAVLYEVLSREPLVNNTRESDPALRRLSLGSDSLDGSSHDDGNMNRPSKRSQRSRSSFVTNPDASASNQKNYAESIAKLELVGIPHSMCALVRDLLDCAQGDFRSDDAYRSLADVRTDLHLMHNDPECYVDDIRAAAFKIRLKFYGREADMAKIEEAYFRHANGGGCGGIIISGGAGVGKSSLLSEVTKKLTLQSNAYYLDAKFNQGNAVGHPLSTIGAMFNDLCELFVRDATPDQSEAVAETLENVLGSQAALLVGVLPSLTKLIDVSLLKGRSTDVASNECIDPAASMQFLFRKLLEALSRYRRMTFFLDDLQWADPASLLLIASMISNTKESSYIFFACSFRDDDVREGDSFSVWLSSLNMFPLERMELGNISTDGANELVSETLHLSPRVTRPLASILWHKTRGNPLFLRQLFESLTNQGYIYFNFSPPRWTWDLNKITDMKISDNVLALLIKDLQRLPPELQMALKVASCIGACAKYSTFDILSNDLKINLRDLLSPVVEKGFMIDDGKGKIRFAHDKVQQAAYEMVPEQERIKNHMRFGLAICSHALNSGSVEHEDLFFLAVHQINRGGPDLLEDPKQKVMIASLNLKAGKRSIELSDFSTALKMFEHGRSFLDREERWTTHYSICLDLTDAAVETACSLNDAAAVRRLSEEMLANTDSSDDKLNCLYAVVKSLRLAFKFVDSKKVAFTMLEQLGERSPRPSDDVELMANIKEMRDLLESMPDDSILNLHETNEKKRDILLLNLYHDLNFLFQFIDTKRIADTSLRMVEIVMMNGLCCMAPLAFAQFAIIIVKGGDYALGYRLGALSLRLLEKIGAQRYTSAVIALVGHLISWAAEPLQSIAESHLLGYKHGQRNGDVVASTLNYQFYLQTIYIAGHNLATTRDKCREFAIQLVQRKQQFLLNGASCLYLQAVAMINGLDFKEEGNGAESLPTWAVIAKAKTSAHIDFSLVFLSHRYTRAFMFKKYDDLPTTGMLDVITANNTPLRPIFFNGIFFEGLTSLYFARQTDGGEYQRKGEAALVFFRKLSKCNKWNFENKYLILEAEMMYFSGYHTQASQLFEDAIRSSHEHKFIHEEAMAAELAGMHHHEVGDLQKSCALFLHSVECYKKWGAFALSKRVEVTIKNTFGSNFTLELGFADKFLASVLAPKGGSSKKRME